MTTIRNICTFLKELAPLHLAEDWDNVGLLLGDDSANAERVITCLTLTPEVADEAVASGANFIVTHHPILFKPVKKLTSESSEGRMLLKLLHHGIAVYSPHTAWDNSATGINQQLAELLELQNIEPLRARVSPDQVKIVTFVPENQLDHVRKAVWQAGAGNIGDYHSCSFSHPGTGTFFGMEETSPAIGKSGRLEQVDEIRLEVVCPTSVLKDAMSALRTAHPYEEPAIDLYPLKPHADGSGSGRCGVLPQPRTLADICHLISERLLQPNLQFVGDSSKVINRIGVACGAAGEFLRDAHSAGCELFVTGEARFHSCLEAEQLGVAMVLPGHYATERFAMETMADRLKEQFSGLKVTASERECDPVRSI